jgi:hypothetical protein
MGGRDVALFVMQMKLGLSPFIFLEGGGDICRSYFLFAKNYLFGMQISTVCIKTSAQLKPNPFLLLSANSL